MKCIPPTIITPLMLASSTVAEPVAPATAWVTGTTYATGTVVSVAGSVCLEFVRLAALTYAAWVSGTTYIIGDIRNSVSNGFPYKRITAGGGTTDPATDATNWTALSAMSPELNTDQWQDNGPYERVWVSGTSYAVGDQCIRTNNHRQYTRLVAGTGTTVPELDPTNWKDSGASRKWAMFDLSSSQQTVTTGPLTVVINLSGRIDSLGITGMLCNGVNVLLQVGATTFYNSTINTLLRNTQSWSQYLFGAFRYRPAVVMFDIPPVAGATLTLTFTGSTVKCGRVFIGRHVDMGPAELDAENDVLNFSLTTRDNFGTATLVPRPTVPKQNMALAPTSSLVDRLRDLRSDTNAKVALWCGLDDQLTSDWFNAFLCPGIWKIFSIKAKARKNAAVTLQLEEIS